MRQIEIADDEAQFIIDFFAYHFGDDLYYTAKALELAENIIRKIKNTPTYGNEDKITKQAVIS